MCILLALKSFQWVVSGGWWMIFGFQCLLWSRDFSLVFSLLVQKLDKDQTWTKSLTTRFIFLYSLTLFVILLRLGFICSVYSYYIIKGSCLGIVSNRELQSVAKSIEYQNILSVNVMLCKVHKVDKGKRFNDIMYNKWV